MAEGDFSATVLACVVDPITRVPGDFEDDLPQNFFIPEDFGDIAFYTPNGGGSQSPLVGMFDDEFTTVDPETGDINTSNPTYTYATKDVPAMARGAKLEFCGLSYNVINVEDDGSGVTMLQLSKDAA